MESYKGKKKTTSDDNNIKRRSECDDRHIVAHKMNYVSVHFDVNGFFNVN